MKFTQHSQDTQTPRPSHHSLCRSPLAIQVMISYQSHKNPVSVSAMLTGKFLQIRFKQQVLQGERTNCEEAVLHQVNEMFP